MPIPIFYSPAYHQTSYAFDTTRKSGWIATSLKAKPISGVELVSPPPLTADDFAIVHDHEYINAIITGEPGHLAESQGFYWDQGLWPTVCASNGGMVAAALHALQHGVAGSLSSGLHHARYENGVGYCTFNGIALAAFAALKAGAGHVLILDLDAHCGGGTQSLIRHEDRLWQLDVSVSSFDSYPSSARHRLNIVRTAWEYLPTIRQALADLDSIAPNFSLCLYNAGMDPCEACALGGLRGITRDMLAERERMVFEWCLDRKMAVAFGLAGGYVCSTLTETELVGLHRMTLEAAQTHGHRFCHTYSASSRTS